MLAQSSLQAEHEKAIKDTKAKHKKDTKAQETRAAARCAKLEKDLATALEQLDSAAANAPTRGGEGDAAAMAATRKLEERIRDGMQRVDAATKQALESKGQLEQSKGQLTALQQKYDALARKDPAAAAGNGRWPHGTATQQEQGVHPAHLATLVLVICLLVDWGAVFAYLGQVQDDVADGAFFQKTSAVLAERSQRAQGFFAKAQRFSSACAAGAAGAAASTSSVLASAGAKLLADASEGFAGAQAAFAEVARPAVDRAAETGGALYSSAASTAAELSSRASAAAQGVLDRDDVKGVVEAVRLQATSLYDTVLEAVSGKGDA